LRRSLLRRDQDDRDVDDELRFHVEQEIQLRIVRGAARADAERAARLAMGSLTRTKETTRAVWVSTRLEQLCQDLRAGSRIVTKAPGLTTAAVALVALVIGVNTTIFSVVHGILTKPAPGVQGGDMVTLTWIAANGWIDLRKGCLRRVRAGRHSDDGAWITKLRAPDAAVRRGRDGVQGAIDSLVLARVERLIGFDIRVALAIPVGVPDERGPALRLHLILRFVEHLRVQPSDHLSTAAGPQRVVRVLGEHEVVRPEAGADVRQLLRRWIVHGRGDDIAGGGCRQPSRGSAF
jgi:hypothetical protein